MALRGPVQSRLAAPLNALFSREFPNRANPVESSSTPVSRRGGTYGARPFSQWILEIWCEASAHMSDPVGIPYVFSTVCLLEPCSPGRPCSAISNDAAWAITETSMCIWALRGYFTWVMSLNPLWEEVTPQRASSKWKGTLSQCYSSPTVWVALGTAVVDLLCVAQSYRLRYRKDQEVYKGRWKGKLLWCFGRDPNSSVIRRDSEWPTERERLGYVCNPRSLKEGTETSRPVATVAVPPLGGQVSGSAPQRKHD